MTFYCSFNLIIVKTKKKKKIENEKETMKTESNIKRSRAFHDQEKKLKYDIFYEKEETKHD